MSQHVIVLSDTQLRDVICSLESREDLLRGDGEHLIPYVEGIRARCEESLQHPADSEWRALDSLLEEELEPPTTYEAEARKDAQSCDPQASSSSGTSPLGDLRSEMTPTALPV